MLYICGIMNRIEYQIGLYFRINGKVERIQSIHCRGGFLYINNVSGDLVQPVPLTDEFFTLHEFRYYNGWYLPEDEAGQTLMFMNAEDGYVVSIDTMEIDNLKVKYIHEAQRLIHTLKGILL